MRRTRRTTAGTARCWARACGCWRWRVGGSVAEAAPGWRSACHAQPPSRSLASHCVACRQHQLTLGSHSRRLPRAAGPDIYASVYGARATYQNAVQCSSYPCTIISYPPHDANKMLFNSSAGRNASLPALLAMAQASAPAGSGTAVVPALCQPHAPLQLRLPSPVCHPRAQGDGHPPGRPTLPCSPRRA